MNGEGLDHAHSQAAQHQGVVVTVCSSQHQGDAVRAGKPFFCEFLWVIEGGNRMC